MSHGESPTFDAYYDQGRLAHLRDERKQPGAAPPLQRLSPLEEQDEQPSSATGREARLTNFRHRHKAETPERKYQIIGP